MTRSEAEMIYCAVRVIRELETVEMSEEAWNLRCKLINLFSEDYNNRPQFKEAIDKVTRAHGA